MSLPALAGALGESAARTAPDLLEDPDGAPQASPVPEAHGLPHASCGGAANPWLSDRAPARAGCPASLVTSGVIGKPIAGDCRSHGTADAAVFVLPLIAPIFVLSLIGGERGPSGEGGTSTSASCRRFR
eukprot:scaffold187707_cov28-Tisochrysis_lutea.AAC.2